MAYQWTPERRARWHAHQGFYDRDPRTLVQVCIADVEQACYRMAAPAASRDMARQYPRVHKMLSDIYITRAGLPRRAYTVAQTLSAKRQAHTNELYTRALEAAKAAARQVMTKQAQP
jgi:hypothetical protein